MVIGNTINFKNVAFELLWMVFHLKENYFPFLRYSSFCIFIHCMVPNICRHDEQHNIIRVIRNNFDDLFLILNSNDIKFLQTEEPSISFAKFENEIIHIMFTRLYHITLRTVGKAILLSYPWILVPKPNQCSCVNKQCQRRVLSLGKVL